MEFEDNKIEWLEFDIFKNRPEVCVKVFLRHGGTSIGPFATLNCSDNVGDHLDAVKVNRQLIQRSESLKKLIFAQQRHGTDVLEVTRYNLSKVFIADALFTVEKDIGLVITHADCQATIFYDPENKIVANVHAGWKGLVNNIYANVVDTLQTAGSCPENLIVAISPSLCPLHAEFKNYKQEIPKEYWDYQIQPFFFDLWTIARKQLTSLGIRDKNIEIAEICTFENEKDYYSYRREKKTGRHATVVALK